MELRNDDLQPVTLLANTFSEVLEGSRVKTANIEELLRKIAKHTDSNTEQLFKQEPSAHEEKELDESDQLRTENLELMMEIQRQVYVTKKWNEVLQQNQNILETVKVWIHDNPELLTKSTLELQNQFDDIESCYKNSINGLSYDIKQSRRCIDQFIEILKDLENELIQSEKNVDKFNQKKRQLHTTIEAIAKLQFN